MSLSGISAVLRAGWVFVLLVIGARRLDVTDFSTFAFWLTVSFVIGLLFDYGQQTGVLTRLARRPVLTNAYVKALSGYKNWLLLVGVPIVSTCVLLSANQDLLGLAMISILGAYFGSQAILLCIPHRAKREYGADFRTAFVEFCFVSVSVVVAIELNKATASSFLVIYALARLCGALVARQCSNCANWSTLFTLEFPRRGLLLGLLPFFIHLCAGTLIVNIDLLLVRGVLDDSNYALYQGGMRLVQAASVLFTMINNVFIPSWSLSDASQSRQATNRSVTIVLFVAAAFSIVTLLISVIFGDYIATMIYGSNFEQLGSWLVFFALIGSLRLVGAIIGALLSARQMQIWRTRASVVGVCLIAALLLPIYAYTIGYILAVQIGVHVLMFALLLKAMRGVWRNA